MWTKYLFGISTEFDNEIKFTNFFYNTQLYASALWEEKYLAKF